MSEDDLALENIALERREHSIPDNYAPPNPAFARVLADIEYGWAVKNLQQFHLVGIP